MHVRLAMKISLQKRRSESLFRIVAQSATNSRHCVDDFDRCVSLKAFLAKLNAQT